VESVAAQNAKASRVAVHQPSSSLWLEKNKTDGYTRIQPRYTAKHAKKHPVLTITVMMCSDGLLLLVSKNLGPLGRAYNIAYTSNVLWLTNGGSGP
jgi:hypothetical protein